MKFVQHQLLIRRPSILALGLLSAILLVSSLLIHAATAQPVSPAPILKSELDYLTEQGQKNGIVTVLVAIKSPDLDTLNAIPLPPGNQTLFVARIKAVRLYSDQARTRLLQALVGYHYKVASGMDWIIPGIALRVDEATLTYLKTSLLVGQVGRSLV